MKTYAAYGFVWALAGAILTFALYFLGFQSQVEKLPVGNMIGLVIGIVICVVFIVLGTKARRADVPPTEPFTYGQALGAALMVALFATLFGAAFNFLYQHFINPGLQDLIVQAEVDKMQARGMSSAQIETAENIIRKMRNPAVQIVSYVFVGMFVSLLVSLITSAFLKREAAPIGQPPPVA